ncbi:MAG: hypothetical protein H6Q52_1062 [Deltaproteobacteria bacterium]|nr:hypothetical protein [Deltaproteobacteria bacterium]
MSLNVARNAMGNEEGARILFQDIMDLPCFAVPPWHMFSPLVIRDVYQLIARRSGVEDPLRKIKKKLNEEALALLPAAEELVAKSPYPLRDALRLSILGNALDIMAQGLEKDAGDLLAAAGSASLPGKETDTFLTRLGKAKKVVYFGDNCGEIVFDRLFIGTVRSRFDLDVVFVVRKRPVLNDATLEDAFAAGIDRVAHVIDNGVNEPIPGTSLSHVSDDVYQNVRSADLIISKGGGNYDLLTDEDDVKGKTTFLVEAKCFPYCSIHRVAPGALIVHNI